MPRSGAIQAALNMDFPGTREYESLAIYFGQSYLQLHTRTYNVQKNANLIWFQRVRTVNCLILILSTLS
jgi:hypothetical protein